MGNVRLWRRFRILPWVILNVSKTGFSLSIGPKGAQFTIGTSGGRFSIGLPGTGLYYTHKFTGSRAAKAPVAELPLTEPPPPE